MARLKGTRLPAEAKPVQTRLQSWRETRRNGTPMPEELWDAAVSLARKHGIYAIARGLPVDYGALKKRVERGTGGDAEAAAGSTNFVEMDAAQLIGTPEIPGPVVELARPDGARMVIRLPGRGSLDVAGLATAFCRGGA